MCASACPPHRPYRASLILGCLLSAALLVPGTEEACAGDAVSALTQEGPQTLTGDWFGQGPELRDAGFDFRLEWSQFYQGMVSGEGDRSWQYGGKMDALARIDLSKLGFWDGLSVTEQGYFNHGDSINGMGGGLLPVNVALLFPGTEGDERLDLMALFVTQRLGDKVSVSVGKFNGLELARATPLRGGGGIDTFWGNLAAPISGITPATFNGALISVPTKPVSYSLMIYDPTDATNQPLFSDLFENGVTINGGATLATSIGGLPGYYSIKGVYSTRTGTDFSEIIQPPGAVPGSKQGSWLVGFSFQQYLVQDPSNPARGWGIFGDIAKSDGNPNLVDWAGYIGVGGSSLIPGRPDDRFGIGYYRLGLSNALQDELAPFIDLRDEWGVEAFYNVAITPWFRVTADLQYIRPSSAASPDAFSAGISSYIRF